MAENKVSVEITLQEKAAFKALTQLTKEVQKTETSFKDMGDTADENLGIIGQAASGVSGGFKSLVAGVTIANLASEAVIGTANAVKNFVFDSVNAAIEAEESTNRLSQALRASSSYSREAVDDLKAYAEALAQATIHGDDEIVNQIAMAKSYGATNKQAKDLVRAAIELSATFGGSVESRVEQLGKTLQGTSGNLATLVPGFKNLTEAQLRSGEAFQFVIDKYDGSAAAQLDTYGGKLNQLTKAYGELQEAAGKVIVENGFLQERFESITEWINRYLQSVSDSQIEEERQADGFKETSASLEQLERKYQELYEKANEAKLIINDPSWFDTLLARPLAAAQNLKILQDEMSKTQSLIEAARPQVQSGIDVEANRPQAAPGLTPEDQKRIDSYKQSQIVIDELKAQAAIAEQEQMALLDAQRTERNELEIEQIYIFENLKLEAQLQAEEEKAMLIQDAKERGLKLQEIAAKREVEFTKLANRQIVDEMKKRQQEEEKVYQANLTAAQGFLSAGVALAKQGSAEQKALSYTDAIVNTYAAGLRAYKDYPYPANLGVMASTIAAGMVQVRNLSRYEQGGIIDGLPTGDKQLVRANGREMMLNMGQQRNLFEAINSGNIGSNNDELIERLIDALMNQPINLVVDGRVLATSVRREVHSGFKIA